MLFCKRKPLYAIAMLVFLLPFSLSQATECPVEFCTLSKGNVCTMPCQEQCGGIAYLCCWEDGIWIDCDSGFTSDDCMCSTSLECALPGGLSCDWYWTCLNSATNDCPFINNIMQAKCQEYADLESSLTPMGQSWSQYVRLCLQSTLAYNVLMPALSSNVDCQTATNAFFNDHVGCYLDGPISFCQLPSGDIARILLHGASILWSKYWYEPLSTGAQLNSECGWVFWEIALIAAIDDSSEGTIVKSNSVSCTDANVTASLVTLVNQRLASHNWTINFESASNVTQTAGTSILFVSSLNNTLQPLNVTLATAMTLDSMQEWQMNNTQCNLTFNGQNIETTEKQVVIF